MRRFLTLLSLMLLPFMVYSAVVFDDGVEPDYVVEEMISRLVLSRENLEVHVSSVSRREGEIRLSIIIGEEEMNFVAKDESMLYKMLSDALFDIPEFHKASLSVDSVYQNLVAANSALPKGKLYFALDKEGNKRALLRSVEELPDEKTLLSPMMKKDIFPGYKLVEGPRFALDFSIASPLNRLVIDTSISLRMVSLLKFLDPKVSINYIYSGGQHIAQVGIGMETHATLSKMTSSSFTLLEDGEIFASVEVLLGYGRGRFLPGVTYTIGYGHYYLPNAYWRIGYSGNLETGSEMRIAGGVLL